ncbi:hypothetical protein [Vibrio parahaemolyticus]|uniref:hypothetical protein n=1 Tax=Vibrio parahaemolyticus TaxID=670 RepID=UPI00235F057D|nr:hypothetical protein [Vibrio parahaemolyticus]
MSEITEKEARAAAKRTLELTADKMFSVHDIFWQSRIDVCKAIVTLTSAVLVGTISFSSALFTGSCTVFLLLAWGFFTLSIVSSTVALWFSYKLSSYKVLFFNKNNDFQQKLVAALSHERNEDRNTAIEGLVKELTEQVIDTLGSYDRVSHWAVLIQFVLFVAGILNFALFGLVKVA